MIKATSMSFMFPPWETKIFSSKSLTSVEQKLNLLTVYLCVCPLCGTMAAPTLRHLAEITSALGLPDCRAMRLCLQARLFGQAPSTMSVATWQKYLGHQCPLKKLPVRSCNILPTFL